MRHILLAVALLLTPRLSSSQEVRLRSVNEVVFGFYKPWDAEKLQTRIPPSLLRRDVDLFVETIEDVGVDPYVNLPKSSFYREIDRLKGEITRPLTRREFLLLFAPVVNRLGLSHTLLKTDNWFDQAYFDEKGGTYFPLDVAIEGGRILVERRYAPTGPAPGEEIVSINQVAASSLIDTLVRHSSAATDYARVMDVQDSFSLGLWWVFGWSGRFRVETRRMVHDVEGLTAKDLDALRREASRPGAAVSDKQYEYTPISPAVGLLVFRDFGIRDTAAYSRFLEASFRDLRSRAVPNLIIDVRGHGGGGDPFGVEIVRYLYDRPFRAYSHSYNKKSRISEAFHLQFLPPEHRDDPAARALVAMNGACAAEHEYGESYECGLEVHQPQPEDLRFKGKVFVLSDWRVLSAGAVFVGLIKDYGIGRIVGTETGQSPSSDGSGCYFLLPNSNVMAMGSTMHSTRPSGDPSGTRGVVPDYEVMESRSDRSNGVDNVMDFTLALIGRG
jgi:hypothetical protein